MTIDDVLSEGREKMDKAVAVARDDFSGVRSGRAAPALIERLNVDYYGSATPLQSLASISVPESRQLMVSVYDQNAVGAVEKAIRNSDLGLNPNTEGNAIRLNFPQLTGERRKDLVRLVRHKAEEGRIAIRNIRQGAKKEMEALESAGEISEDELRRGEKKLQEVTDAHTGEVDAMLRNKEQELLED